jgi:alpha-L-fucosidase
MAKYAPTSPWADTRITNLGALDVLTIRAVPAESDDAKYTLETQYTYRPDLLAYDIYGSPKLWWVFAQRNMDVIKDPVYDMVAGTTIYLPKADTLKDLLGI